MNGVCVRFRGWLDLKRLDGVGSLEFDERRAAHEDVILKDQIERYNQRVRDFEDKQRMYRDRHAEMEQVRRNQQAAGIGVGVGVGAGGVMWRR